MIFKFKKRNITEFDRRLRSIGILYASINPYQISRQERNRLGWDNDAYVYGEIKYASFFAALTIANPKPYEIFL